MNLWFVCLFFWNFLLSFVLSNFGKINWPRFWLTHWLIEKLTPNNGTFQSFSPKIGVRSNFLEWQRCRVGTSFQFSVEMVAVVGETFPQNVLVAGGDRSVLDVAGPPVAGQFRPTDLFRAGLRVFEADRTRGAGQKWWVYFWKLIGSDFDKIWWCKICIFSKKLAYLWVWVLENGGRLPILDWNSENLIRLAEDFYKRFK